MGRLSQVAGQWGLVAIAGLTQAGVGGMSKRPQRRKHVPQRTCVVCRTVRSQRDLVRIVRTPEGVVMLDETGKRNGRGAYLCKQSACWDQAIKRGSLSRALRVDLQPDEIAALEAYAASLSEPAEDDEAI